MYPPAVVAAAAVVALAVVAVPFFFVAFRLHYSINLLKFRYKLI